MDTTSPVIAKKCLGVILSNAPNLAESQRNTLKLAGFAI